MDLTQAQGSAANKLAGHRKQAQGSAYNGVHARDLTSLPGSRKSAVPSGYDVPASHAKPVCRPRHCCLPNSCPGSPLRRVSTIPCSPANKQACRWHWHFCDVGCTSPRIHDTCTCRRRALALMNDPMQAKGSACEYTYTDYNNNCPTDVVGELTGFVHAMQAQGSAQHQARNVWHILETHVNPGCLVMLYLLVERSWQSSK